MSKHNTTGNPSPDLIALMAKDGIKKPHIDAVELLDLLADLSEVELPLPLLERIRNAQAKLMEPSSGGSKGAEASKETRRGPQSKQAAILKEAKKYAEPTPAQVAAIARKTGSTTKWVREVLRKSEA